MASTLASPAQVEAAFGTTGCDWILAQTDRDKILVGVAKEIAELQSEYQRRFGESIDPFSLLTENRTKGSAFFQVFSGPPLSIDFRILVWRLLAGLEIRAVDMSYKSRDLFIRIVIGQRDGDDEVYESQHPWDFAVLQHLGMLLVSGKLVLEGYYALRDLGPMCP